jgi:hypothetical protein
MYPAISKVGASFAEILGREEEGMGEEPSLDTSSYACMVA